MNILDFDILKPLLYALGFTLAFIWGVGITSSRVMGKHRRMSAAPHIVIAIFIVGSLLNSYNVSALMPQIWQVVLATIAMGSLRPLDRGPASSMITGVMASAAAVACAMALSIWVFRPHTDDFTWAAFGWLVLSLVVSPLLSRYGYWPHRLSGCIRGASYKAYLAPDDAEVRRGLVTEVLTPSIVSLHGEICAFAMSLAIVCTGLVVVGLVSRGTDITFLLPAWTVCLTWLCAKVMARMGFAMPVSNKLAYLSAMAALYVFATSADLLWTSFGFGCVFFALQAVMAAAVTFVFRLPMEAIAPIALTMLGFPGMALAVTVIRGEPSMAKVMGWLVPSMVLLLMAIR